MKIIRQLTGFIISLGLLSVLMPADTSLADTRTKITEVNLNIDSSFTAGVGGDVYVTTSDTAYTVSESTILNDDGEWTGNFRPRVSVYLEAGEDYYFSGTSKSIFHFTGDSCTFVSAKRRDSGTGLEVIFKMGQIGSGDLTVTGLEWDPSSGIASWDEVAGAKSYQVCLYRGSSSFSGVKSTTSRRYNFSSLIDQKGDYFFRVRAIGYNSEKGEWEESDTGYVSAAQAEDFRYENRSSSSAGSSSRGPGVTSSGPSSSSSSGPAYGNSGSWVQDTVGWWYRFSNGSYPVNCWQYIGKKWYFFNQYGYMAVGWIQWNSRWYYCGSDGSMYINGRTPDGYYVGGDGAWIP